MSDQTPPFSREWIREFAPGSSRWADNAPLVREIVIQQRAGNYFDIYQTWPERRLLTGLTLDECIGYAALAIGNGHPARWDSLEHERESVARYHPERRALEPWEKQLPAHMESKGEPS